MAFLSAFVAATTPLRTLARPAPVTLVAATVASNVGWTLFRAVASLAATLADGTLGNQVFLAATDDSEASRHKFKPALLHT